MLGFLAPTVFMQHFPHKRSKLFRAPSAARPLPRLVPLAFTGRQQRQTEIMVLNEDVIPTPPTTDDDATPPPVASVTPAPATVQPVSPPAPTPVGTLETVGTLPLAGGPGSDADVFAVKVRSALCVGVASCALTRNVCSHATRFDSWSTPAIRRRTKEQLKEWRTKRRCRPCVYSFPRRELHCLFIGCWGAWWEEEEVC